MNYLANAPVALLTDNEGLGHLKSVCSSVQPLQQSDPHVFERGENVVLPDEHGIDGPLAAAVAFAARLAHREFGQGGLCRTIRLDSSSPDGMHGRYEAFIDAPTERHTAPPPPARWP